MYNVYSCLLLLQYPYIQLLHVLSTVLIAVAYLLMPAVKAHRDIMLAGFS